MSAISLGKVAIPWTEEGQYYILRDFSTLVFIGPRLGFQCKAQKAQRARKVASIRMGRELDEWVDCIVRSIPGTLGIRIRNRFYRGKLAHCGRWPMIQSQVMIRSRDKLHLGDHVELAWGVFISAAGGVRIGNRVGIGPDTKIWSDNHVFADPSRPFQLQGWEYKEVLIEDDVWLGAQCVIKPGVTIGKGAVISAGTILSKSVPPYAIVAGNPGRVVGWRSPPEAKDGAPEPSEPPAPLAPPLEKEG